MKHISYLLPYPFPLANITKDEKRRSFSFHSKYCLLLYDKNFEEISNHFPKISPSCPINLSHPTFDLYSISVLPLIVLLKINYIISMVCYSCFKASKSTLPPLWLSNDSPLQSFMYAFYISLLSIFVFSSFSNIFYSES